MLLHVISERTGDYLRLKNPNPADGIFPVFGFHCVEYMHLYVVLESVQKGRFCTSFSTDFYVIST